MTSQALNHTFQLSNLLEEYLLFPYKTKRVFDTIKYFCETYLVAYMRQDTIADCSGCSRKHVNRVLRKLESIGLVKFENRGRNKTCIYKIPEIFKGLDIQKTCGELARSACTKFSGFHREVTQQVTRYIYISLSKERDRDLPKKGVKFQVPNHLKSMEKNYCKKEIAKMAIFPEAAYRSVVESAKKVKKPIKNMYSYIWTGCKNWCDKQKIALNWSIYYQLK